MVDNELIQKVEKAKEEGKKVGLVQGSWDLFHLGHLRYILKARELCDFLIIAMDSDQKIKKRKGNTRPIIPEDERKEFIRLLSIADEVVVKAVDEPKWGLIKSVRPDVLIAIKDNYTEEQIEKLEEFCGRVAILPRQSESSTSDKIRKIMISNQGAKIEGIEEKLNRSIQDMKDRVGFREDMPEPIPLLFQHLKESTDWVCPVAAACHSNGQWYFGVNTSDFNIPKYDVQNRTELYYATTEHAEVALLKKLGDREKIDFPIWVTLFPCDKCMKVLINKGVKEIYYLEDHPERNWSKRSHALAEKNGVKTIKIFEDTKTTDEPSIPTSEIDWAKFKYIYPPNVRYQEQLDIMMNLEGRGEDPLDVNIIEQEVLFTTENWYVSRNRFPYEGAEHQFLIVANKPVLTTDQITPEMWSELQLIWFSLVLTYNIPGGALCARFGDPSRSGASLKRFHVHLISPKEENKVRFPIGGHKTLKKGFKLNLPMLDEEGNSDFLK